MPDTLARSRAWGLPLAAAGIVLAGVLATWALHRDSGDWFVVAHGLHAAVYLAAVWWILQRGGGARSLALIVAVAIAVRLLAVTVPPVLTTDAYRYVWDGRLQAAGYNPYLYVPADEQLAKLRDATIYPNINRKETHPTIYPPVAELLFRAAVAISDSIRGVQIIMLLCDLVAIWAIYRWLAAAGAPTSRVLIYAWHPLPLWEFAGMGHIDAAGVALIALALLAAETGRQGWAGAALAAAGLTKYYLVLFTPALWRRWRWQLPLAMIATVGLLYLPYISAGPRLLGSLFVHLGEEGYGDGYGFYLVGAPRHWGLPYLPSLVFAGLAAAILLALGAVRRSAGDAGAGRARCTSCCCARRSWC